MGTLRCVRFHRAVKTAFVVYVYPWHAAACFSPLYSFSAAATLTPAQNPAPTPPMGWNSWDAYGLTINEADFKPMPPYWPE